MENEGFLVLQNVPGYDQDELLKWQKWFYALPKAERESLAIAHLARDGKHHPNTYRGFAPFLNNDVSHKEMFEIGLDYDQVSEEEKLCPLHEYTPWPKSEDGKADEFKRFMNNYYQAMSNVGQ